MVFHCVHTERQNVRPYCELWQNSQRKQPFGIGVWKKRKWEYDFQYNQNTSESKCNKKSMLREHKPPPIRRIRISDFGLPDPKRDPDRHQNCITWSLSHALPLQKISSKSVHKFASNPTDRQTEKQTEPKT